MTSHGDWLIINKKPCNESRCRAEIILSHCNVIGRGKVFVVQFVAGGRCRGNLHAIRRETDQLYVSDFNLKR